MMPIHTNLLSLKTEAPFAQLPSAFYAHENPQALANPELVIASAGCAQLLDLDPGALSEQDNLAILSGQAIPSHWKPLAMKYFGHQFGYLNPDLGDGRGLLLAQARNSKNELWDLHLKGAGTTPYSRGGDGRAVLRSSIREFLASEALSALGVASTRALAVVSSQTPVYRETQEQAATLLRVAKSHIRFGHFEFAYHSKEKSLLEALCRYCIETHYPCLENSVSGYADMFKLVCESTASMIAKWQCLGFAHGVMNTDNMSILGDTFDYGPYGFMDTFTAGFICNHSDREGRYAFDRQPAIGQWNLSVLAQALSPVLSKEALNEGLASYSQRFNHDFLQGMKRKLGLSQEQEHARENKQEETFIFETFQMLQQCRFDYSFFFRQLSQDPAKAYAVLRDHSLDLKAFDDWYKRYDDCLVNENKEASIRTEDMRKENPYIVLRNHLAQAAIEAAEKGDYGPTQTLHQALLDPYAENEQSSQFAELPPEWAKALEVSCSS